MQAALLDWNHSSTYVSGVLDWAARDTVGGAQAISPVMVGVGFGIWLLLSVGPGSTGDCGRAAQAGQQGNIRGSECHLLGEDDCGPLARRAGTGPVRPPDPDDQRVILASPHGGDGCLL
jgi:hypothetical protein